MPPKYNPAVTLVKRHACSVNLLALRNTHDAPSQAGKVTIAARISGGSDLHAKFTAPGGASLRDCLLGRVRFARRQSLTRLQIGHILKVISSQQKQTLLEPL